jgi:hypothetical protein
VLVAVANLAVCGAVLAAVSAARPAADAPAGDFRQVTGPAGMTTYIPAGWRVAAADPGVLRAEDPAGAAALRFGAVSGNADVYARRADCARRFAATRTAYAEVRLERTLVRGAPAVDWEFEYGAGEDRRHVRSVHWRRDGREYFVGAAAPAGAWSTTREVLEVMLTYSTP